MNIKLGYVIKFRAPLSSECDRIVESFGKVTEIRGSKKDPRYMVDVKGPNFWDGRKLYLNRASIVEILRRPFI